MWPLRIIAKAMTDEYKTESLFVKLLDILLNNQKRSWIYMVRPGK